MEGAGGLAATIVLGDDKRVLMKDVRKLVKLRNRVRGVGIARLRCPLGVTFPSYEVGVVGSARSSTE